MVMDNRDGVGCDRYVHEHVRIGRGRLGCENLERTVRPDEKDTRFTQYPDLGVVGLMASDCSGHPSREYKVSTLWQSYPGISLGTLNGGSRTDQG